MEISINSLRKYAQESGKNLVYNRSTGEYQIIHGFTVSLGEIPFRDEKGKLCLNETQLTRLKSYV